MQPHRRRTRPAALALEPRWLPSAQIPTATWIGQDGVDLTGPSSTLGPDGVQDIDIAVSNLPGNETVAWAQIYGYGADEWDYNGTAGHWAAAFVRAPGATTGDFYIDPSQIETGRSFQINLYYGDGTSVTIYLQGGTASPTLRTPSDTAQATWIGQDGHDLTGMGPNVGPNGIQDVHISLSQLSPYAGVQSVTVASTAGETWQFGLNPQGYNNAELVVNPTNSSEADLYFSPDTNMAGQGLTITITYTDGTADQSTLLAGTTDPTLAMPAPAPVSPTWNAVSANWLGQDGTDPSGPGYVHVALAGLSASSAIASVTVSDEADADWYYNPQGSGDPLDGSAGRLTVVPGNAGTSADLYFAPIRNETGATLTVTVSLSDGSTLVTRFAGGTADLGLLSPSPAATSILAQPGADLNALVTQYGNIHLAAGTYTLDQPLVLSQPVTISADAGATLLFDQSATAPTWDTAIELAAGNITLEGFSVRFAAPVRWTPNVSYSPAVIGAPDNFDPAATSPVVNVTITGLNVQTPPAATSWEEAPSLMRLVGAHNGTITNNTLEGGTIEFIGGPWTITGNNDLGTVAGTYSLGVIAGHYTHDVTIADNTVEPIAGAGKTYRFLVLTQEGVGDVVQDNTVIGVGPMDSDTEPDPNASEVILTESYRLQYEGMLSSVSPDGWVVQIPNPQNGPARTGDVVAILTGPDAGQWRTIAQALNANTYLLDAPITPGNCAISITDGGFVNETFKGNTVDTTGSSSATDIMLAGNHFGVQVVDNTLIGGNQALALLAYPTEQPDIWGWSHTPILGAVVNGNTFENTVSGAVLDVTSDRYIKSSAGRTYFSATLDNNSVVYTQAFLAQRAAANATTTPPGIVVGDTAGLDPAELVLSEQGNTVELPPGVSPWGTLQIDSGTINGVTETNQAIVLPVSTPPAPANLSLVNDNGAQATDGVTSDTQLQLLADPSAAGYEYSLSGVDGTYQPIATPSAFQPAGLTPGFNVVYVRGYNLAGARGPVAAIAFLFDPTISTHPTPGGFRHSAYEYRIGTTGPFEPLGVESIPDPSAFASGAPVLQLQTVKTQRNTTTSASDYSSSVVSTAQAAPSVASSAPSNRGAVTKNFTVSVGPPTPLDTIAHTRLATTVPQIGRPAGRSLIPPSRSALAATTAITTERRIEALPGARRGARHATAPRSTNAGTARTAPRRPVQPIARFRSLDARWGEPPSP